VGGDARVLFKYLLKKDEFYIKPRVTIVCPNALPAIDNGQILLAISLIFKNFL
jgi:hypothetical protein